MKTPMEIDSLETVASKKYFAAQQKLNAKHEVKLISVKNWYDTQNAKVWQQFQADIDEARRPEN